MTDNGRRKNKMRKPTKMDRIKSGKSELISTKARVVKGGGPKNPTASQ